MVCPQNRMGEGFSCETLTPSCALKNRAALSRTELGLARVQRLSWPKSDGFDFGWERAQEARAAYSGSPCSIMQVRCIASCCVPQVDCDIFPALPLQSRSAFSRAALMPDSPRCPTPSLRCAKLGVAKAETASPSASAAATCLFLRPITNLLPTRPSRRDNARGRKSSAAPLCIPASLPAATGREPVTKSSCHATRRWCALSRSRESTRGDRHRRERVRSPDERQRNPGLPRMSP
jgi:hypothetical protein